jgi:hypothetical protein
MSRLSNIVLAFVLVACAEPPPPRPPLATEPLEHEPTPGIADESAAPAKSTMHTPKGQPIDPKSVHCRIWVGEDCYGRMTDACSALDCRFDHKCLTRRNGSRTVAFCQ